MITVVDVSSLVMCDRRMNVVTESIPLVITHNALRFMSVTGKAGQGKVRKEKTKSFFMSVSPADTLALCLINRIIAGLLLCNNYTTYTNNNKTSTS